MSIVDGYRQKYFAVVVSDVGGCREFKLVKQLELSYLTPLPTPLQSLMRRCQFFKGMCVWRGRGGGVGEAVFNKNLQLFTKRSKS